MSTDAKPEPFEVHYDGLRDDQGLIPAFGPVRLDNEGASSCRRKSGGRGWRRVVRALRAIEQLPDDDPPGTEEQFMRNFDENHPHRPQFKGYY